MFRLCAHKLFRQIVAYLFIDDDMKYEKLQTTVELYYGQLIYENIPSYLNSRGGCEKVARVFAVPT